MQKRDMKAALTLPEIRRYHMVETIGQQDVAQHSFRVAFIAGRICQVTLHNNENIDPKVAMYWGMVHDLGEYTTGDIPTHVKKALRRRRADPDDLATFERVPDEYKWMVKAADYIEAIEWLSGRICTARSKDVLTYITQRYSDFLNALDDEQAFSVQQVYAEATSSMVEDYELLWKDERK